MVRFEVIQQQHLLVVHLAPMQNGTIETLMRYSLWLLLHSIAKVYEVFPFHDVKCICSGGQEWGREESHCENIFTKFKSQGLYAIKIKYWNASGSGFPPSLIPALRNIGILHHKKEKLRILLQQSVNLIINCMNHTNLNIAIKLQN